MRDKVKRLFLSPDSDRLVYESEGRERKPIVFPDDPNGFRLAHRVVVSYNLLAHFSINELDKISRFAKGFPDVNWVDIFSNHDALEIIDESLEPIASYNPATGKTTMIRKKRVRLK